MTTKLRIRVEQMGDGKTRYISECKDSFWGSWSVCYSGRCNTERQARGVIEGAKEISRAVTVVKREIIKVN